MENSTNYDLKLYEGSDKFNPLNVDVPNFETIDEVMKANETAGVQPATELVSGTVHEITRSNADAQVFRFVATGKWEVGDSMSIDGTPVTVLLPSGKSIPDGAYVIGANVIGVLVGTNCTLYLSETGGTAEDSEKLGGELPSYYATASGLENTNIVVTALGNVVTPLNSRVDAHTLNNSGMVQLDKGVTYIAPSDGYVQHFSGGLSTSSFSFLIVGGLASDYVAGNGVVATCHAIYVKKGMSLLQTNDSTDGSVRFTPLI